MLPVSGESMALTVVSSCHTGTYFTVFMATVEQILTNVLYLQIPLKKTGIFGGKKVPILGLFCPVRGNFFWIFWDRGYPPFLLKVFWQMIFRLKGHGEAYPLNGKKSAK